MASLLTDEEIAGHMGWKGPGAYTAHAMRRVRRAIDEAAFREREACAKVCEARHMGDNTREDVEARHCADAIRARHAVVD